MNKSLKDTLENHEKTIKQVIETIHDYKTEMELKGKKTQTKEWLDK